jgi:hypothetical protein
MEIDRTTPIVRHDDGSLLVHFVPERPHESDDGPSEPRSSPNSPNHLLHPGEGGYDEALIAWDEQQHPEHAETVSTAIGRHEAIVAVHAVAASGNHAVAEAVGAIDDPEASAEALRYVLVGGPHAVEDFAKEIAALQGDDPMPTHVATKIIGEVLAELG